ncbi:MAG: (Fe-S)-binding protein [Syntrophotaleaceae bacterium]
MCVKCGVCRAHCPVFGEEGREAVVARGKVTLAQALLDGEIDADTLVAESLSKCLLCGKCVRRCPTQVPVDDIVLAARREIAARRGLSLFGRSLGSLLRRPRLMQALTGAARRAARLLFRRIPQQSGLRLRFPAPFISRQRSLPPFAAKPFRRRHPAFIAGRADRPLVALFSGCMVNHCYPQIGDGALQALTALGFNVAIPKGQGCCGLPALSAGDGATASELAERNLRALAEPRPDYIVTLCASCYSGLTHYFRDLGLDYAALAERVVDIHTLLVREGLEEVLQQLPKPVRQPKVTWHTPCHLRNAGLDQAPQKLLAALPTIELIKMHKANACCGLGGTFSVHHYQTSRQLGAIKAAAVAESGAEAVATACPGCIMQLQDSLDQAGLTQRACHVLELIGGALEETR